MGWTMTGQRSTSEKAEPHKALYIIQLADRLQAVVVHDGLVVHASPGTTRSAGVYHQSSLVGMPWHVVATGFRMHGATIYERILVGGSDAHLSAGNHGRS